MLESCNSEISLAKVSDWNSFRVNQNYSDSFRYLYPSRHESFRTNPKNVLYLVWWKTVKNQSDLIRLIPRHQSEWIRNRVFNPDQFKSIRARIDPSRILNQNQSKSFRPWIHSDWKFGSDQPEHVKILKEQNYYFIIIYKVSCFFYSLVKEMNS